MQFVTEEVKSLFNRAKFSKERTEIPNDHPAIARVQNVIDDALSILGLTNVFLSRTRFTYTVIYKDGEVNIYAPYVGSKDGVAVLCWGDEKFPISDIKSDLDIIEDNKRFLLEVADEEGNALELTMMVRRKDKDGNDVKFEKAELRKALKQGRLGEYLSQSFVKPLKLKDVQPGTYTVTGYESRIYEGDVKYTLFLEGVGAVSANTALNNRLSFEPEITPTKPATLVISPSTKTTNQGHPIIPTQLTTAKDLEIPVFDFCDGLVTDNFAEDENLVDNIAF
ncbi:hypothetical protein [Floridanema aerugineum]|uniref:Uncharacterized protein n=1 Tax=Floridaenema aerugineum BLCC-F46 TaxID=3153654 RepID=A0ABV4X292_9CYAN